MSRALLVTGEVTHYHKPRPIRLNNQHYCPTCGQLLQKRSGKHGHFWGCQGYPDCKYTFPAKFNNRSVAL